VLNLGVGGYNTTQETALLAALGVTLEPDVVVLGFCLNDLGDVSTNLEYIQRAAKYGRSKLYRLRVAQWVQVQLDNIATIRRKQASYGDEPGRDELGPEIDRLQRELSAQLEGSEDPPQFLDGFASPAHVARLRNQLMKLRGLAAEHGFPVVAVVIPYLEDDPLYQYAYRILEHEFARQGFGTINVYEDFRSRGFEGLQRGERGDSVHPNRDGHEIIARRIQAYLEDSRTAP
jgi:lysophospholipase L1-like esterase